MAKLRVNVNLDEPGLNIHLKPLVEKLSKILNKDYKNLREDFIVDWDDSSALLDGHRRDHPRYGESRMFLLHKHDRKFRLYDPTSYGVLNNGTRYYWTSSSYSEATLLLQIRDVFGLVPNSLSRMPKIKKYRLGKAAQRIMGLEYINEYAGNMARSFSGNTTRRIERDILLYRNELATVKSRLSSYKLQLKTAHENMMLSKKAVKVLEDNNVAIPGILNVDIGNNANSKNSAKAFLKKYNSNNRIYQSKLSENEKELKKINDMFKKNSGRSLSTDVEGLLHLLKSRQLHNVVIMPDKIEVTTMPIFFDTKKDGKCRCPDSSCRGTTSRDETYYYGRVKFNIHSRVHSDECVGVGFTGLDYIDKWRTPHIQFALGCGGHCLNKYITILFNMYSKKQIFSYVSLVLDFLHHVNLHSPLVHFSNMLHMRIRNKGEYYVPSGLREGIIAK